MDKKQYTPALFTVLQVGTNCRFLAASGTKPTTVASQVSVANYAPSDWKDVDF